MKLGIFILAAGRGERLRPITDHIPKPILPILGKPVLESIFERVSPLSDKIGVNLHYRRDLIESWIKQSAFGNIVNLFPEDPVLGTGGALKNAENFLKDGPFLIYNSDIISDIDLRQVIEYHLSSENLATLAVHDYPEFNKLKVDNQGAFKGIAGDISVTAGYFAFTGIAVYSPEFLSLLPCGESSVIDAWLKAVAQGYKIGTIDVTGCYWTDIGTPAAYAKAVLNELRDDGETVYIHPDTKWCERVEMDGHVVIEKGSSCDEEISLRNCIILPGTNFTCHLPSFKKGGMESYKNCILGPGFEIDIDESHLFNKDKNNAVLIGTGGSDRRYYRIQKDGESVVLMQCSQTDQDFERHVEYTHFFRKYSIPVPELIKVELENKNALFEDVGDISLYSWLKCPRKPDLIEKMYRKVLDILISIHVTATAHLDECQLLRERVFDYEHLRWETGYFIERFVEGIGNMRIGEPSILQNEFHRMAVKVDSFSKTIVHRDFQSQNIMITKGGTPRLIDFQGARVGPPAYDVASILWDPYFRLDGNLRERLLNYYIQKMISRASPLSKMARRRFIENEFRESLLPCRLQRHMQALGAYGYLSVVRGRKYFSKYIPEGLRLLKEDAALANNEYPALNKLVKKL